MNVTEVRDSDFKNAFPGIFNFTVGILTRKRALTVFHLKKYGIEGTEAINEYIPVVNTLTRLGLVVLVNQLGGRADPNMIQISVFKL